MIQFLFRGEGQDMQVLEAPRSGVWVHATSPTKEELATLVDTLGLEPLIVDDISDFFEVPRFEQEGSVSYFFTRYPHDVKDADVETAPLLIVLGDTFVLTVSMQEVPFLLPLVHGVKPVETVEKSRLFLQIVDALFIAYDKKLTRTRKIVHRDMGRVRSMRSKDLQRLVLLEQELNETIAALVPTNAWLGHLMKGNYLQLFHADREQLEDLMIDGGQIIDSAKSILKTMQNIRTANEAMLTQNLNTTIRTLTAVTIVLTIPTLISSLFGMNVPIPFAEAAGAFWFILGFILAAVALTIYFFSRNRWL